jgi:hypothetical protein
MELYSVIIAEVAGAGFQSRNVPMRLAELVREGKAFNSMKVKYSY